MKKLFGLLFLLCLSKAHATTINGVDYGTIWNPFGGHLQYTTALSSSAVTGSGCIVVTTTTAGVTITNICGSGGSSSLAVSQSGIVISSPTSVINFLGPPFSLTLVGGATAQVGLNSSSVTLQGLITAGSNITITTTAAGISIASSGGGSGTVTSLTQGSGILLGPNPITTSGIIQLDPGTTYWITPSSVSANYLTQSSATVTYLSISSAQVTYLPGSVLANIYLTQSSATATYLLPSVAAAIYLTQSSATATYLLPSTADFRYIQNRDTLQTNATYYVSSGTVQGNLVVRGTTTVASVLNVPNGTNINVFARGDVAISSYSVSNSTGGMMFYADQKYHVVATTGPAPQVAGYVPKTTGNGTTSWQPDASGGGGSVSITAGSSGLLVSPSPITGTGVIYLLAGNTNYISNQNTLQTGSTFYTSSGSVSGQFDVSTGTVWRVLRVGNSIQDAFNGNGTFLLFQGTTTVANYFAIQNSSTGANPVLIATGTDSNVNFQIGIQGLGGVVILTSSTVQQSSMVGGMVFNSVNSSSTAGNFQIKGSTDSNLFVTDSINNTVSIGSTTAFPLSKFWVTSADNQTNMTSIINVAQAGLTALDTFIDFRSATGSEGSVAGTAVAGVIAFNTFTGSHYTEVTDRSTLKTFDLLCSTGERITRWPSSHDEQVDVGIGPVYNLYYKNLEDIPPSGLLELRGPIVVDASVPAEPNLAHLTSDGFDFLGIDQRQDPQTGFPVLDRIGSQYTYQETGKRLVTIHEASIKGQLFQSKVCSSIADASAIGAYGGTDGLGRDLILSMGTGQLRVANKGRDIRIGDFLVSSDIPGSVEQQPDDIYRNKTVGKATENLNWQPGELERVINVIYLGG